MRKLLAMWLRMLGLLGLKRHEVEFDAELDSHVALHIADGVRYGLSKRQARREALVKLGGVEAARQNYRERLTVPMIENLLQDLHFSSRQLSRSAAFTLTSIVMLALGTGASVAIFAFVDAALLKPLPYRDPSHLASVTETVKLFPRANLSYPDYLDWKKMNTVFQSLEIYYGTGYVLNSSAGTEQVNGLRVSDGFFRTLGVKPILGRDFYTGEDLPGVAPTVLMTYAVWKTRYNKRPDIVGQTVELSGVPTTVVGVLPEDFQFAPRGGIEFFGPFHAKGDCDLRRSCHGLVGIGRLKDGVSIATANAEMVGIAAQLEKQYPDSNRGQGAIVEPLAEIIVGDLRPILLTLLTGAGLLLLIACVNVASLLLVRSESRRREFAVRGALGASRSRLIRQFVTEGAVLVTLGTMLGLMLAFVAMRLLLGLIPKEMLTGMPFLDGLGLNTHVLLFTVGIGLAALVMFAVTPMLRLPMGTLRNGLAEGARGSAGTVWRQLGTNLVVLELAIAVVLLVGAGLLGKSLYRLLHVQVNFQTDHLATVQIYAPESRYPKDPQLIALEHEMVRRLGTLPGVESVGFTSVLPVSCNCNTDWIRFVGKPYNGTHNEVNQRDVSPDYFKTLHAKLISGRWFDPREDGTRPKVAIINRTLARQYYPGEDPLGKKFGDTSLTPNSIKTIVGIVDDVHEGSLESPIWAAAYYPYDQDTDNYFAVAVRTSQDEAALLPEMIRTIHSIDPSLGTSLESTMDQLIQNSGSAYLHRSSAWLVGGFAALALLLSVVGLYGVIAFSVSQRTREIGVRMALGAQRGSVYGLVMREAGRLMALGLGLGLLSAVGAAMLMRKLLYGTEAWDGTTLVAVAAVLGSSALLASFLPAHRAASVNPVEALRAE